MNQKQPNGCIIFHKHLVNIYLNISVTYLILEQCYGSKAKHVSNDIYTNV